MRTRVVIANAVFMAAVLAVCIGLAWKAGGWAWLYCPFMWVCLMASLYGPVALAHRTLDKQAEQLENHFREIARQEYGRRKDDIH